MSPGKQDTPRSQPEAEAAEREPASEEHEIPGSRATGIRHTGAPGAEDAAAGEQGGPRTDETQPWLGRIIDDRYEIVDKLGEGGMGAVFVAEHRKLQKPVALKVILPQFAGDGEMAARFAREAMASAKLDHPHVASALDYGTLPEGGAYLVMQLVRGRGLNKLLEEHGRMPWPAACNIVAQVADALAAAHAEGIVHRDLKPENVLLEKREQDSADLVKVLDFGIARVSAEESGGAEAPGRALTRLGTVMGTPGYMSPEQAVGEQVDHRADLYALGVVLWEMVVGRRLFEGNDLTAIVTKQLTEMPPPLIQASEDASVPPALEQLVARMLARKPEDRPDRASEVRDTLRQLAFAAGAASGVMSAPSHITGSWGVTSATGAQAPAPAQQATAQTMLAAPSGTGHQVPPVQAQGTIAPGRESRVPTRVDIGGRSVPVPAILAGCAVPAVIAALVVVLIVAFGGEDEPAGQGKSQGGLAGLLSPSSPEILAPKVPPEVQERIDTMLESNNRRERHEAAKWLQDHEPADEVPDYAAAVAGFELARGCRAMEKELEQIVEVGDERALPAVERIANKPERGCGFLSMRDCYACMRSELAEARRELGGDEGEDEGN